MKWVVERGCQDRMIDQTRRSSGRKVDAATIWWVKLPGTVWNEMTSTIDIELGCAKDESSSRSRDTQSNKSKRQSTYLLGKETFLDAAAEKRILWAQRGIGVFSVFALFFYIVTNFAEGRSSRNIMRTLTTVFGSFALACAGCLYYKNISFVL